ncbi:hypothetical protein NESM_000702000 [Novymonas esmeraldas]|uniref:Uncharacterized protein n=1 Tax=Novymonas esmeraldas TaxID=1808958 RepID=A0AAW0ETB5_9TRYP
MTSPTHSHASTTGSRRHHTPLLQERSNSLLRRQEMLKRRGSQSSSSPSTSQRQPPPQQDDAASAGDVDGAIPGTAVVCGVRSAFPLIPAASTPPPEAAAAAAAPGSSSREVPGLRRHSSSGSGGDDSWVGNGTHSAELPAALRSHHHTPRGAPGRPPLVRASGNSPQQQPPALDAEGDGGAAGVQSSEDAEDDEFGDARGTHSTCSDAASPHRYSDDSDARLAHTPAGAAQMRSHPDTDAPKPARTSVHTIAEAAMAHTPYARGSIHGGGVSPEELDDEQPAGVEVRQRRSRYLTHESFENHKDDGRRVSQPEHRPRLRSHHAQHEEAAALAADDTANTGEEYPTEHGDADVTRVERAFSHSHSRPARTSVHTITEAAMAHTPYARGSIHGGGVSPEELDDEQPAGVEVRQRRSRYLTHESFENHKDDGRRVSQPEHRPRLRSHHAQHEEAAALAADDTAGTGEEYPTEFTAATDAERKSTSPPGRKWRALSHSHSRPARTSVHTITEAAMAHTPYARGSIHGGGVSPEELDDEQPAGVEVRQRRSRYLTHESFENHKDDGRRVSQPEQRPRLRSHHAQHEEAATPSPYAPTAAAAHRRSLQAGDTVAPAEKPPSTSATSAAQLLARTEERHRAAEDASSAPRGDPIAAHLRTVGPRVMSASSSSADRAQPPRRGRGSVYAAEAELQEARQATSQAVPSRVMSASEARRRVSRHAVESQEPVYADGDERPTSLKTVGARPVSRTSAAPSDSTSRRSVYGAAAEHVSDAPMPVATAVARSQAIRTSEVNDAGEQQQQQRRRASRHASEGAASYSPVAPQKRGAATAALPPRASAAAEWGAAVRRFSHASRHSSYADSTHSGEDARREAAAVGHGGGGESGHRRLSAADAAHPMRQLHTHTVELGDEASEDAGRGGIQEEEEEAEAAHYTVRRRRTTTIVAADGGHDAAGQPSHPTVRASIVELDFIRPSRAIVHESSSGSSNAGSGDDNAQADRDEEAEDGEYRYYDEEDNATEYISCYDVACQTSQHLMEWMQEEWGERAAHQRGADDDGHAVPAGPAPPHYLGANRWMCAAGICPECHPGRSAKTAGGGGLGVRGKSTWPLAPRGSIGYSTPPRLATTQQQQQRQRQYGTVRAATAGRSARLPPLLPSSTSSPASLSRHRHRHAATAAGASASYTQRHPHSTYAGSSHSSGGRHYRPDQYSTDVTAYQGGYCFTREWDAEQRQRQRRLRELQMEQSARRGGTGAAYTSLLLLTSHDVRASARAAGKAPSSYRYCNLESEQMMVHTGYGRADLQMHGYNDTLHGAPLITPAQPDDDGAAAAVPAIEDRHHHHETGGPRQLHYPALPTSTSAAAAPAHRPAPRHDDGAGALPMVPSNSHSSTSNSVSSWGHAHNGSSKKVRPTDGAGRASDSSVLYCDGQPYLHRRVLKAALATNAASGSSGGSRIAAAAAAHPPYR